MGAFNSKPGGPSGSELITARQQHVNDILIFEKLLTTSCTHTPVHWMCKQSDSDSSLNCVKDIILIFERVQEESGDYHVLHN